jgi:hypothetical protein
VLKGGGTYLQVFLGAILEEAEVFLGVLPLVLLQRTGRTRDLICGGLRYTWEDRDIGNAVLQTARCKKIISLQLKPLAVLRGKARGVGTCFR